MTTEECFHAALDADPRNHFLRQVFADWLDEQGDPRGPGYRALGLLERVPRENDVLCPWFGCVWKSAWDEGRVDDVPSEDIPKDWFDMVVLKGKSSKFIPDHDYRQDASRREIEDAVAEAFSRLPSERQHELLNILPSRIVNHVR